MMSRRGTQSSGTNKPSSKAQYRPIISSQSRRSSQGRRPSRQSQPNLNPISERYADTVFTEGTVLLPREPYEPPFGYDPPAAGVFLKYIQETGLKENFWNLCFLLLNRSDLPYNPYPGFVGRLRQNGERFHLESKSKPQILKFLAQPIQEVTHTHLYMPKANPVVCGLSNIIQSVDSACLMKYDWLLDDIIPDAETLYTTDGYTNQIMIGLVGQAAFHGTFYPHPDLIQIRMEHLITGAQVSQGITVFVNSVMAALDQMEESSHILLGVNLPATVQTSNTDDGQSFWSPEQIQETKEQFLQELSDTVMGNKLIYVECIFKIDPDITKYYRGQIQYGLNFIAMSENSKDEGLSSFTEFPMALFHEGVFLKKSMAEAYMSVFAPTIDSGDSLRPPASRSQTTVPETPQSHHRRFSVAQERDESAIHRHVYAQIHHIRPQMVRIDGFRLNDDEESGPYSWHITSPIKSHLQKSIAASHAVEDFFEIVHCIIILALIDRASFGLDLLLEAYKVLHGTAGQLNALMEQNKAVQSMVKAFVNRSEAAVVVGGSLWEYKAAVEMVLLDELHDRSSDIVVAGKVISGQLNELINDKELKLGSVLHCQKVPFPSIISRLPKTILTTYKTLDTLKGINSYCLALRLLLVEDSARRCKKIHELIASLVDTFPECIPRPATREHVTVSKKKTTTGTLSPNAPEQFRHGFEEEAIMNHDRMVLNVEMCIERDTAPKIMSVESVLMKYLLDSRVDEVWQDFMMELAGGVYLPPNPFPRLVTFLRQCAMRMDLCYEKSSVLHERLTIGRAQLEDPANFVYTVEGTNAYGPLSALATLDTNAFFTIIEVARQFAQTSYIQKKGSFKIGICPALSGWSPFYGKMIPYLLSLDLHEHYYIQGPPGCAGEAVQLFAKIVCTHVTELCRVATVPIMGMFMGSEEIRWTKEDILTRQRLFTADLERVCLQKEPICFKAFAESDWRMLPVNKYFLLHYLTDESYDTEEFFEANPGSFYQNVFFTRERAAFHYQNGGPLSGGDPLSVPNIRIACKHIDKRIMASIEQCNFLSVHKDLLLKALISGDSSIVLESWRMFHSITAQTEYVVSLCYSLQDMVVIGLEEREHYQDKLDKQEPQPGPSNRPGHKLPEMESVLNREIINKMIVAVRQKLKAITECKVAMAATCLSHIVDRRFQSIIEKDSSTQQYFLIFHELTISILEDIINMLRLIQDCTASDVHSICPEAVASVHDIASESWRRPGSVASTHLDDPDLFTKKPSAQIGNLLPTLRE